MPGKIIPDNLVEQWMREGRTDGEIVELLRERENIDVTRQAISAWRKRTGKELKRTQAPRAIPWKLRPEHAMTEPARTIRTHARIVRGDTSIPEHDRTRYERVKRQLDETVFPDGSVGGVFHYDATTVQGWFVVPRRPGVDLGVVHEPKVTTA